MYYWKLEKYKGTKSRYTCPNCQKKNEFTRYIDAEDNHAGDIYGVCNRVEKCGYSLYPDSNIKQPDTAFIYVPEPEPDVLNPDLLAEKYPEFDIDNNLISFLIKSFPEEDVLSGIKQYYVKTEGNKIVYPYISKDWHLRYIKVMDYKSDGHRGKSIYAPFRGNYKACLFGLHLVTPEKRNMIVESEKTAIICSILMPQFTWLATGGIQNLSRLKDIDTGTLMPDKGKAFTLWNDKKPAGFDITDFLENQDYLKEGDDMADCLLSSHKI